MPGDWKDVEADHMHIRVGTPQYPTVVEPFWLDQQWQAAAPVDLRGLGKMGVARSGSSLARLDAEIDAAGVHGLLREFPPPPSWERASNCPVA